MARAGKRVLMYDCDPKRNLTLRCVRKDKEIINNINLEELMKYNEKKLDAAVTLLDQVCIDEEKPDYTIKPAHTIQVEKNLFLVPGHRDMCILDGKISIVEEFSTKKIPGAINVYTARPFLAIESTANRCNAEYILLDMDLSNGVLNQRLISMCDYLIVTCLIKIYYIKS